MSEFNVVWEPQAGPQTALLACPCFEVFFGGARGGGKTDGMLGEWASHADLYGPDANGLMVRRQRTELIDTIRRSHRIYGMLAGWKWHEQDKTWTSERGAQLRFAYLERDTDAEGYQGHSYTRVYVEELGNFRSPEPVLKLMATLRSGAGVPCGFRATGNPGGPGQSWVRARYIDPSPPWTVQQEPFVNPFTGETIIRDRVFIPSNVTDNRYLGSDYVANLMMQGSPQLVKAWLGGDWSAIEGAFFGEWDESRHVVAPFSVPGDWLRFRSMDWGSAKPFSVGWWAVAGDDYPLVGSGRGSQASAGASGRAGEYGSQDGGATEAQGRLQSLQSREPARHAGAVLGGPPRGLVIPRGALIRYREWYGCKPGSPNTGLKLHAEQVAEGIKEREAKDKIAYGVADPSMFSEDGGPSLAERMAGKGVVWRPADNARVGRSGHMGGWDMMRQRLVGEDGVPMVYTFSTCRDSIRTIPVLQHDQNRPEDLDTEAEDHAADEWRYGMMSRPWVPKPKTESKPDVGYRSTTRKERPSWRV